MVSVYYRIELPERSLCHAVRKQRSAAAPGAVKEHAQVRLDKGEDHWEAYRQRKEEERKNDTRAQQAERMKEIKTLRTNAILWLCAFTIFGNLAVQLYIRGADTGFVVIAAAAFVYVTARWIMCLYALFKMRR